MSTLKCPGAEKIRASFPDEVPCACGMKVEMWPDDAEVRCPGCGGSVGREAPPACIEWCTAARECVGESLYERYTKARKFNK
ncbi:MAG: phosphohydrolase [Candidatus Aureabacteria bacterium]|nr:phosphohydrolase [Candidatus Auribacterota bacterium]